jgi:hypothetical protein
MAMDARPGGPTAKRQPSPEGLGNRFFLIFRVFRSPTPEVLQPLSKTVILSEVEEPVLSVAEGTSADAY